MDAALKKRLAGFITAVESNCRLIYSHSLVDGDPEEIKKLIADISKYSKGMLDAMPKDSKK